jgi:hypothetical protein
MHFTGLLYRAHNPVWSRTPLSGEGAARFGGRERPTVIEVVPSAVPDALPPLDAAGVKPQATGALLVRVPPRSASVLLLHFSRFPSGWHVTHDLQK